MEKEELISLAKKARLMSYSPYSHFPVGAALLCQDGAVYLGSNIENASFPLTMCAERNAIYNAMCHDRSQDEFVALAIVADTENPVSPCGACRQVISELFPENAPIYLANLDGDIRETNAKELLPFAFQGDDL
ncbi:MAG: cytidine deaminase [Bacilli bacterium]|nr:cytidine deaminase [Bacilli bacterium]